MNKNLIELEELLQHEKLGFKECDSRMNYGMIGHLYKRGESLVMIFGGSFYVSEKDLSINRDLLRIIELIRIEFTEVSRDNNNRISPVELGNLEALKKGH